MPANNIFQIRRGTQSQWNSANPVLASGEPGYDITNNIYKIGDGVNSWNNLKSILDISGNATISGVLSATSGNFSQNLLVNNVPVSISGHTHNSSNITDFNSSVNSLVSGIYQPLLINPVVGFGDIGYLTKWSNSGELNNSLIYDDGTNIGIGTTSPLNLFSIEGTERVFSVLGDDLTYAGQPPSINLKGYTWFGKQDGSVGIGAQHGDMGLFDSENNFFLFTGYDENVTQYNPICLTAGFFAQIYLDTNGNVGIGITNPTHKLDVDGDGNFTSLYVNNVEVSTSGHSHTSADIIDFNSVVSGLLPTIANSGDNRLLTSTGTSTGINAENNLTFDGSLLNINGSGVFSSGLYVNSIDNIILGRHDCDSLRIVNGTLGIYKGDGTCGSDTCHALLIDELALYDTNSQTSISWGDRALIDPSGNRVLYWGNSNAIGINYYDYDIIGQYTLDVNGSGHFASGLYVDGNLVANTGTFDIIQLNTDNGPVSSQGQLAWNDTEGTVDIALTDTAIINIGEHEMYRIRNTTGNVLYKGQAVMASGVHLNGIIAPSLYAADGSVREIRFMGLVYENVNHNNNGYVIHFGHIYNIDTRGNVASNIAVGDETWNDGDILYVHPTVAGKLTNVEPKHSIAAAIVLNAANNGKIFVRPTSYGHLNDNHDVNISGATNGQFLQYNASTDYWIPSSSGNFSTLLVNGTGVSLSGHSHISSDITDFDASVSGLLPVTNILGGSNITVSQSGTNFTVAVTGSLGLTTEEVDDRISNLLVAGTGISLDYNDTLDTLTINTSGLQPSGNYSIVGHSHSSADISDFNTSVSGLLPTISNSGDNRLLTSTGSSVGVNAENNLTFDGSFLNVVGSGNFDNIFISGIALNEVIDDEIATLLVAGSGINLNYNDNSNTLTVDTSASTSLVAGNGVSLDYNSTSDTLTINIINFIHPFLLGGM